MVMFSLLPLATSIHNLITEIPELTILQGNTLVGRTPPESPIIQVLNVKIQEIDLNGINTLLKVKYPEIADILIKLIECESGFNPDAWNKKDPNGGSIGILQYQIPTFYYYASKYGIENPDIWNSEQQIELAVYLIQDNKITLWTCGRIVGRN